MTLMGPDGSGCLSEMNNHEKLPVFEANALLFIILGVISSKQRRAGGGGSIRPTTLPL